MFTLDFKSLVTMFILALLIPLSSNAISRKVPKVKHIPQSARQIACGCGWTIYLDTGYELSGVLYLEDDITKERYELLRTIGERNADEAGHNATEISIKAKNTIAYGKEEIYDKKIATYEYGYIQVVEEAYVLERNLILVSGVVSARNNYNYIINLENYTAIHIPSYLWFEGSSIIDGKRFLEFINYGYRKNAGRIWLKTMFDINGNKIDEWEIGEPLW